MKKRGSATREEAAKAGLVQRIQIEDLENQQGALRQHSDQLIDESKYQSDGAEEIESSMSGLWAEIGGERPSQAELDGVEPLKSLALDGADREKIDESVAQMDFSASLLRHEGDWSTYVGHVEGFARTNGIDLGRDPFDSLLSARQQREIKERIETDFDEPCDCDRWDYAIAATCGALSGLVDAFLVGYPTKSLLGGLSDEAAEGLVQRFAEGVGWPGPRANADASRSAIGFLERTFRINYDHRHGADVGHLFEMSASNHHIKSLAHSPSPIGLLFSVLDQFTGQASFVSDGSLIRVQTDSSNFRLEGSNLPAKLFAAFCNWIGHILSDMAGASGSETRGSGVPIPFFRTAAVCQLRQLGR